MLSADNTYSRLVAWLKVILPLVALAILSTLFLVAETLDPEAAIPYAEREAIDTLVNEQGISAPAYSAVSKDGTAIRVSAASASMPSEAGDALLGEDLLAEFSIPDGAQVFISAPEGSINSAARLAKLDGGATLESSTGYVLTSETIVTNVDGAFAETAGLVTGNGPIGTLDAGRMRLHQDEAGRYLLHFTDGVRLLYEPQSEGAE